jgi:MFS family permease
MILAASVNLLSYMDRVAVSMAAPRLQRDLHFGPTQMGVIFGAFSLCYALAQAPWGALADRRGARRIVALGVAAWSVFTGLTALTWNFLSLLAVRFLFGLSEAAGSPAVASVFRRLVAEDRRSTAFGFFLAGGRLGGAIAPYIAAFLMVRFGWRWMFLGFAVLGACAVPCWLIGVPRRIDSKESEPVRPEKMRKAVFSPRLLALLAVSFGYTVMWQFYITWFPTYLMEVRGFNLRQTATYASLPLLFGLFATWGGGSLCDSLGRRFGMRSTRRLFGWATLAGSAALLFAGAFCSAPGTGAVLIALAAAGDLLLPVMWAVSVEIGGPNAGAVAGLLNGTSNLGAFVSPIAIGWLVERSHNWLLVLEVAALVNVAAALVWTFATAADKSGSKARS